jgi:hypothetical protein
VTRQRHHLFRYSTQTGGPEAAPRPKRPAVLLRLDPDVHAAIVTATKRDDRLAQYVLERIVLDWLRTRAPEDALKKPAK